MEPRTQPSRFSTAQSRLFQPSSMSSPSTPAGWPDNPVRADTRTHAAPLHTIDIDLNQTAKGDWTRTIKIQVAYDPSIHPYADQAPDGLLKQALEQSDAAVRTAIAQDAMRKEDAESIVLAAKKQVDDRMAAYNHKLVRIERAISQLELTEAIKLIDEVNDVTMSMAGDPADAHPAEGDPVFSLDEPMVLQSYDPAFDYDPTALFQRLSDQLGVPVIFHSTADIEPKPGPGAGAAAETEPT